MADYNQYFIDIKLSHDTAYVYSVRKLLHKALDRSVHLFYGKLLDLGCGEMPYRPYILDKNKNVAEYIGIDIDSSPHHQWVKPDMVWDGKTIGLEGNTVDTVIATEFFEHIPNAGEVLKEINRVLTKDGLVFFTVPFIWPLHEVPYDQYRYTPYSLQRILKEAGFKGVEIFPLGGYNAALAQMLCIWIFNARNTQSTSFRRRLFGPFEKYILYPVIEKLLLRDERMNVHHYGENTMPAGFYGYARK